MDDEQLFAARTRIVAPPLLPEISLHVAEAIVPLWEETATDAGTPPPYWGFPWVGGQAVARYLLDHPEVVRGKSVFDVGTGSGLLAIVAARAGASVVRASDIDPRAGFAAAKNATLNGVTLELIVRDVLDETRDEDVILAGDLCYEQRLAERVLGFLHRHARAGATVLIGDAGRTYFDSSGAEPIARYDVETTADLEGRARRAASVFRLG